jgi:hypothetical protein
LALIGKHRAKGMSYFFFDAFEILAGSVVRRAVFASYR